LEEIMQRSHRTNDKVIFDEDPKRLIEKVVALIKKDKSVSDRVYRNHDGISGESGNVIL
jgi:hypothetical protein